MGWGVCIGASCTGILHCHNDGTCF
jgi:hypothetical protein